VDSFAKLLALDAGRGSRILVRLGVGNLRFAHMLLFACPDCRTPIVAGLLSGTGNLEDIDADYFLLQCGHCQESFHLPALSAKRHYVEEWEWDSQNGVSARLLSATSQLALFEKHDDQPSSV